MAESEKPIRDGKAVNFSRSLQRRGSCSPTEHCDRCNLKVWRHGILPNLQRLRSHVLDKLGVKG
jgi:hypothetical protein